jgi:hypothetical protein
LKAADPGLKHKLKLKLIFIIKHKLMLKLKLMLTIKLPRAQL